MNPTSKPTTDIFTAAEWVVISRWEIQLSAKRGKKQNTAGEATMDFSQRTVSQPCSCSIKVSSSVLSATPADDWDKRSGIFSVQQPIARYCRDVEAPPSVRCSTAVDYTNVFLSPVHVYGFIRTNSKNSKNCFFIYINFLSSLVFKDTYFDC